jgi:hypothetical protein
MSFPTQPVAMLAALMFVFGTTVLVVDTVS